MQFVVTVDDKATQAQLQALQQKAAKPGPVLRDIGTRLLQEAKARFETSLGADGLPWKPKKAKDGRKTLVGESGNLRRQMA